MADLTNNVTTLPVTGGSPWGLIFVALNFVAMGIVLVRRYAT